MENEGHDEHRWHNNALEANQIQVCAIENKTWIYLIYSLFLFCFLSLLLQLEEGEMIFLIICFHTHRINLYRNTTCKNMLQSIFKMYLSHMYHWIFLLLGEETNLHPHLDITSKILEANKGRFHITAHICDSVFNYFIIYLHNVLSQAWAIFWWKVTLSGQKQGMPWNAGTVIANGKNPMEDWSESLMSSVIISVRAQWFISSLFIMENFFYLNLQLWSVSNDNLVFLLQMTVRRPILKKLWKPSTRKPAFVLFLTTASLTTWGSRVKWGECRLAEALEMPVRIWTGHSVLYRHCRCWSTVGRKGGEQVLSLSAFGCLDRGIIQHELLHALGFYHEHTRSDRDHYVRINWANVPPGQLWNYEMIYTFFSYFPTDKQITVCVDIKRVLTYFSQTSSDDARCYVINICDPDYDQDVGGRPRIKYSLQNWSFIEILYFNCCVFETYIFEQAMHPISTRRTQTTWTPHMTIHLLCIIQGNISLFLYLLLDVRLVNLQWRQELLLETVAYCWTWC